MLVGVVVSGLSILIDAPSREIQAEALVDGPTTVATSSVLITASPSEVNAGKRIKVSVLVTTDDNPPDETLSVRINFASGLTPLKNSHDENWTCEPSIDDGEETSVRCTSTGLSANTTNRTLSFRVRTEKEIAGFRGITAIAWFGEEEPLPREWRDAQRGAESDSVLVLVKTPKKATTRSSTTSKITTENLRKYTHSVTRKHAPDLVQQATTPSSAFCQLFGTTSSTSIQVTAGPVTFSNLGNSKNNGGQCSSSSNITLSASTIRFGNVVFTNVSGAATPTSISLQFTIGSNINLSITGPFPDTGTQFAALVSFPVGKSNISLNGVIDYSNSSSFSVSLSATASGLGWSPFPNVSLSSGGLTGTFTRSIAGAEIIDSVTVAANFSGSWDPISEVSVSGITASISNATGPIVISLGATLSGAIDIAGLNIPLNNIGLNGSVNTGTGVLTTNASISSFSVMNLATFGPVSATVVYDPNSNSNNGKTSAVTATISGTAAFTGAVAQFFQGSVSASIALYEEGFVVEAALSTAPSTPGYPLNSPRFVWASLEDELSTISYQSNTTEPNSTKQTPPITLRHQSALAVAPFGVPRGLSQAMSALGISILDDVGTGTIAIGLPPADPSISIFYSPPPNTFLFGNQKSSTSVEFEDIFVSIAAGETETFTIGGDVALTLSSDVLQLESALTISSGVSGFSIGGYLELSDATGWPNAFGLQGVTLYDLVLQAGMADGLPSFAVEAQASFPSSLTSPLGIVSGSVITLGIDFSATNPCFLFAINPPNNKPKQNVIQMDSGSLTASSAQVVVAPDGCQIGKNSYSGFQLEFNGAIRGVDVGFETTFQTSPSFSLVGSGYVDSFPIDGMTFKETTVNLAITDTSFSLKITGGISAGTSLNATGKMLLESGGGYSFTGNGIIKISGDDFNVSVKATNCADSSCSSLTIPTFWVSGGIDLKGFGFQASIEVQLDGKFTATLTVPKKTTSRSVSKSGLDVTINITYSFYVEVSDTGSDEVKISISLDVKSCKWEVLPCGSPSVSASADVKTGSASLTISFRSGAIKGSFTTTVN